jgi:hypothetical protein
MLSGLLDPETNLDLGKECRDLGGLEDQAI